MKHSVKRRRLSQPTVALGGESYPVADPCTRYPIATLTSTPARKGSDKKRAACKSLKYTRGKKTKQNGEMRVGGGDGTGETRRRNHERLPIEEGCEGRVFSSLYIFMQRFPPRILFMGSVRGASILLLFVLVLFFYLFIFVLEVCAKTTLGGAGSLRTRRRL